MSRQEIKNIMEKKIPASLSWRPELLERLKQIAKVRTGGNLTLLVDLICQRYLDRLDKKAEETSKN